MSKTTLMDQWNGNELNKKNCSKWCSFSVQFISGAKLVTIYNQSKRMEFKWSISLIFPKHDLITNI